MSVLGFFNFLLLIVFIAFMDTNDYQLNAWQSAGTLSQKNKVQSYLENGIWRRELLFLAC